MVLNHDFYVFATESLVIVLRALICELNHS